MVFHWCSNHLIIRQWEWIIQIWTWTTTDNKTRWIRMITFKIPWWTWIIWVKVVGIHFLQVAIKTSNSPTKWTSGASLHVFKITKLRKNKMLKKRNSVNNDLKLIISSKDKSNNKQKGLEQETISPSLWTERWLTSISSSTRKWNKTRLIAKLWQEKIELKRLSRKCNWKNSVTTKR